MNYIENGDFGSGQFDPGWRVVKGPLEIVLDEDGNYALFEPGAKLSQHWLMARPPESIEFSLEVRVENGSDEATGKVQVVFGLQQGPVNYYVTFNIPELSAWRVLSLPLNLRPGTNAGTVELVVQPSFTEKVSMRNIAITDDVTRKKNDANFELDLSEPPKS